MNLRGTLFLHGYGVRGETWKSVQAALGATSGPTWAPDLNATSVGELIGIAVEHARSFSTREHGSILLAGHSLGAVLAALAAQRLGPKIIAGAVLIAPPFGEREQLPGPVMKFLLRHRLVPPFLLRPRFFSAHTPIEVQKEVFANAVPEAPALREMTLSERFFHTDRFDGPLPVPSLVLASRCDRIVPAHQSETFGKLLGSEIVMLGEDENVGHDDFFASPKIAARTAGIIRDFAQRL
ncbi:MAG: alpha/beta fold hydrolase [Spirochaetota bacterium]